MMGLGRRSIAIVTGVLLVATVATTGAWWARRPRGGGRAVTDEGRPLAPPDLIAMYGGLRSPERFWTQTTTLVQSFGVPLPAQGSLADVLSQSSGLGKGVVAEVDFSAPLLFATLDGTKLGAGAPGGNPTVWAVPIRDEAKFLAAIRAEMKVEEKDGALVVQSKDQAGRPPVTLVVAQKHALAGESAAHVALARPFLLRTVARTPLSHDLEVHVRTSAILADRAALDAQLAQAMPRLGPLGGGVARRSVELLRDAREAVVALDLAPEGVTAGVTLAPSSPGGVLAQTIARQAPAAPFAADRLPADAWIVWSDHYGAAALAEVALDLKAWSLDGVVETLTGDVSVAAHAPADGPGLAVSAVAGTRDAARTLAALDAAIAKTAGAPPADHGGIHVAEVAYHVVPQAQKAAADLFGDKLSVAYGAKDALVAGASGKGAEEAVRAMLAGPRAPSLAQSEPFSRAVARAAGRTGLIYASPDKLTRGLLGMLSPMLAQAAPTAEGSDGVQIDWGAAAGSGALEVSLRLPQGALSAIASVLRMMSAGAPLPPGHPGLPSPPLTPGPPRAPKFHLEPPSK